MWYFLVITTPQHNCRISPHPLTLDHTQGYLSSYIASTTLCGSQHSPWVIQGREGQKINLTLYDFSVDESVTDNTEAVTCQKYAMVSGKLNGHISLFLKVGQNVTMSASISFKTLSNVWSVWHFFKCRFREWETFDFNKNWFLWWFIQRTKLLSRFHYTKRIPGFIKFTSHCLDLFCTAIKVSS